MPERGEKENNRQVYTTGQFAKLAHISQRTLRFYDKKGLLKPSFVLENGYRQYTQEDLAVLQKILLFKHLGFSLEEISYLLLDDRQDLLQSLKVQKKLVQERISHLNSLGDSLSSAIRLMEDGKDQKNRILDLIEILNQDDQLVEQYRNAKNLQVRIRLHQLYSGSSVPWFSWLFGQIDFSRVNRLLEIGCGNGQLWKGKAVSTRHREIFLSDISGGMIEDAKSNLHSDAFSYMVFGAESIPFRRDYFDAVVANHVLFYIPDLEKGIQEIARVLRPSGRLYASAYGKGHMKEITDLVHEFDPQIFLSSSPLWEKFGMENGEQILSRYFECVEFIPYLDCLKVTDPRDLADYILSCHGNQNEKLVGRYEQFLEFLSRKMEQNGYVYVTKEVGLFIASAKKEGPFQQIK